MGRPRKASREELKPRLAELRARGLGNQEAAQKLGVATHIVASLAKEMIQAGLLKPLARGRKPSPATQQRKDHVAVLRQRGYTNRQIAAKLKLCESSVQSIACALFREQRIARRHDPFSTVKDLTRPRAQTILKMIKERATLKEIGHELGGLTRQRVYQLVSKIVHLHGREILKPSEHLWTARDIAENLNLPYDKVTKLCRKGVIPYQQRGKGIYLIDSTKHLKALKQHPLITGKRTCKSCGKTYFYEHGSGEGSRSVCPSKKCLKEWRRYRRAAYAQQQPTLDSLRSWHRELWQKLQCHRVPTNEEWMTITAAQKRTKLSSTQIDWLRHRNMVRTQPHPTKPWHDNQPVQLFAASEMEIVREVYQSYLRRQQKRR